MKRIVWFVLALLAGSILLGTIYAVIAATQSRAFVMEPLRVPPALVHRGVDGTVLASRLVDNLRGFEAGTGSIRAPSSYSSSWEEDVRIAIPQVGISLGEAWRYLRDWLGNDTRVQGEAFATEFGLGITVRTSTMPGQTFTGTPSELDRLVREAALALYKDTQPYRYGIYMLNQGRADEAASAYRVAIARGGLEAAWGHRGMGLLLRDQNRFAEAAEQYRTALRLVPDHQATLYVLAQELEAMGHSEEALATWIRTAERREEDAADMSPAGRRVNFEGARGAVASLRGDLQTALRSAANTDAVGGGQGALDYKRLNIASLLISLHDLDRAEEYLSGVKLDESSQPTAGENRDYYYFVKAQLAEAKGDTAGALAAFRRVGQQAQGLPPVQENVAHLGYYMALAGDVTGGERVAAATDSACYPCVIQRLEIAILKRDWRAAERLADQAARLGPSLPYAYYLNGRQLLARGNIDGAIRQFQEAHRRGPRWAEPLKGEGEALLRQQRFDDAAAAFEQAAERAPRWGELHLDWARALWAIGRKGEAVSKLRSASGMSLKPVEAERLRRMWTVAKARA